MPFVSTRGGVSPVSAAEAILQGLAGDGGLYMPSHAIKLPGGSGYAGIAASALHNAFGENYEEDDLRRMAGAAYGGDRFDAASVCPLIELGGRYVLELFHGPTASFKDLALSLLPSLMAEARDNLAPDREILVLTATSGDTGSATMAGFQGLPGIRVIVFYPKDGVSPVQAAQMQRMAGGNLDAVAISGDFDQAQQGVKAIFRDAPGLAPDVMLSSANSINIGRLIPQMAYYADACRRLGKDIKPVFSVPTGNFGDIFAGLWCQALGLPASHLICATNDNRVLKDALESGVYDRRRALVKTLSPSMDILLASNFERAVYLAGGSDSQPVGHMMRELESKGVAELPKRAHAWLKQRMLSASCSDAQALDTMSAVYEQHGYLLDPHSAAAWYAVDASGAEEGTASPAVVLATASPFKFPVAALRALKQSVPADPRDQIEALQKLTGLPLPRALEGLFDRPILHDKLIAPEAMSAYVLGGAAR